MITSQGRFNIAFHKGFFLYCPSLVTSSLDFCTSKGDSEVLTEAFETGSLSTGSASNERSCRTTRWIGCTGFMFITEGLNEIRMVSTLGL